MKLKTKFSIAIACYLLLIMGCVGKNTNNENDPGNAIANTIHMEYSDILIIKVKDCDYVFWYKGSGSDMEHYEGCQNPDHK